MRFFSVGESSRNVAITALATSALPDQPPQLFARLSNYGDQDAVVILDGRLNGSSVIDWAYRYTIPARGEIDLFDIELPPDFDTLTTSLTLPSGSGEADYLALDLATGWLARWKSAAGLREGQKLPFSGQALVRAPVACGGLGECGVCAVRTRSGWSLACKDGPVYDLANLEG